MKNKNDRTVGNKLPATETGNASNPSPKSTSMQPASDDRLFPEKAETYLRESGNIEDLPDANEEAKSIKEEKEEKGEL